MNIHEEKGIVLVTSLIIMGLLMVIGTSIVMTSSIELDIARNQKVAKTAFYRAENGRVIAARAIQAADGGTAWSDGDNFESNADITVSDGDFFSEGFGQFSVSQMQPGVLKAWHIHKKQVDWWYVHAGIIKVALYDTRKDSPTYKELMELLMGDGQPAQVLRVPPGVAHGCRCIEGPASLFYITSKVYDPDDELRRSYNDPEIDFDWFKESRIP